MGFGLSIFGFQNTGGEADTNTNIANTNLTADANRSLNIDGNTLDFDNGTASILQIKTPNVIFGGGGEITSVDFRMGTSAPLLRLFEASGGGIFFGGITLGNLSAERTYTLPDATGTIALTSDIGANTNLANTDLTATGNRIYDANSASLTFSSLSNVDFSGFTTATFNGNKLLLTNGASTPILALQEPSGGGTFAANIIVGNLTDERILTLPNATGTFALTSDIGANTNIANTNLTADNNRTLDMDGNELQIDAAQGFFIGQGTASAEFELNSEIIRFKSGNQAPDFRIFEDSDNGTNYVKLTCGALAANRTLTMPDATGTIALTSDVNSYTAGDGITLNTLEFDLDAAQTIITSITNAALKLGRDSQNLIDFATTDNKIIFRVNNVNEVELSANNLSPVSNGGCALGTTSLKWSNLFLGSSGAVDFNNGNCSITNNASGQLTFATASASRGVVIPSRNFIPSTSTDGNVASGDVVNFGSGTVVAGVCYYFTSAGAWANTDQRAVGTSIGFLGVAMGSGTASDVGMCIRGMVTMATDVGSVGGVVYLQRSGNFDSAPSTSSGDTNRVMGYCLDDSDGQIFFNPSQDWVTVA
jgi:hypothetical protein